MKLLTASLFSVALCAGAWAQNTDTKTAETKTTAEVKTAAEAKTQDKPSAKADKPADAVEMGESIDADAVSEIVGNANRYAKAKIQLNTMGKRVGYAFGLNIGMNLKSQEIELDVDSMVQGLKDALDEADPLMDQQAVQAAMIELQQHMQQKQLAKARVQGGANKTQGDEFLANNAKAQGVKTTASGLQYKIIEPGKGESPKPEDVVSVHYVGTLIDGTEFDSSYKRNQPATFPVGGVIPGWTEALQLMKPGAKFKLFIPANLAYGEQGAGDVIAPNATLIFDVELLSIKDAGASNAPAGHSADDGHNH